MDAEKAKCAPTAADTSCSDTPELSVLLSWHRSDNTSMYSCWAGGMHARGTLGAVAERGNVRGSGRTRAARRNTCTTRSTAAAWAAACRVAGTISRCAHASATALFLGNKHGTAPGRALDCCEDVQKRVSLRDGPYPSWPSACSLRCPCYVEGQIMPQQLLEGRRALSTLRRGQHVQLRWQSWGKRDACKTLLCQGGGYGGQGDMMQGGQGGMMQGGFQGGEPYGDRRQVSFTANPHFKLLLDLFLRLPRAAMKPCGCWACGLPVASMASRCGLMAVCILCCHAQPGNVRGCWCCAPGGDAPPAWAQ